MIHTLLPPVTLDLNGFLRNLRREGTPDRVFYFEHGVAETIQRQLHEQFGIWDAINPASPTAAWDRMIATHRFLGQEFFRVFPPGARLVAPRKHGEWTQEGRGAIATWEEFEAYPWPDPRHADLAVLDYMERVLPKDMRVFHVVDIWEVVRDSMGFETLCFALYEEPRFVEAIFERVGGFVEKVVAACLDYNCYGAVYLSDDLAYRTSLMIAPDQIRRLVMPWHKRIADLAHAHGKLFFFHCCGDMYDLIDDYIDHTPPKVSTNRK